MKYKVVKLDHRYAYNKRFKYLLEFVKSNRTNAVLDYHRAMRWFHDHYGWTQEAEVMHTMRYHQSLYPDLFTEEDFNPTWSYCSRKDVYRIYVEEEKVLEWFLLCHPKSS